MTSLELRNLEFVEKITYIDNFVLEFVCREISQTLRHLKFKQCSLDPYQKVTACVSVCSLNVYNYWNRFLEQIFITVYTKFPLKLINTSLCFHKFFSISIANRVHIH